ncbi:MAG: MazG family protein [Acidimicrobiales bacterium]
MHDASQARLVIAGLGPGGDELVPESTRVAVANADRVFLRTARHPGAALVLDLARRADTFDDIYDSSDSFDKVYARIVETLVDATSAAWPGTVVYCVPGSPLICERTVELLRADGRITTQINPAMSFLDLAWVRLGVDPVATSVRLIDGTDFAAQSAGERGPFLVAQTYNRQILSEIKLSADRPPVGHDAAILLHHLGLEDEMVIPIPWAQLDHRREPQADHLTALWIPQLEAPIASEMMRLVELVRILRERCPWDREQTHGSLARHLLEEAYEALDAIEDVAAAGSEVGETAIAHLEEELGDLVFQVVFHSALASEQGWFTLADVAERLHTKLVGRHPHVFGDASADTPEDVARRWELLKRTEQGRSSIVDGIPRDLPALALAAKLQRKAESIGMSDQGSEADGRPIHDGQRVARALDRLGHLPAGSSGETLEAERQTVDEVGEALLALANLARRLGVDPESALRARAGRLAASIREAEQSGSG